jgi:hypothetical protein
MEDNLGATVMSTESNVRPTDGEPTVVEGGGFEPKAPVEWATLSEFRVQIHKQSNVSVDVFANGRQQAPIEVVIQARDKDGVAVNLTDEQLKGVGGIRLIEYETNRAVVHCTHAKDERFVYEWPVGREDGTEVTEDAGPSEVPRGSAQVVSIYVRKTDLTTTWIAAEFSNPVTGAIFRTNTPNPSPGKFDSWVKLRGRQPEAQQWDCFAMTRENAYNAPYWDVDLYYIRFTKTALRIVASRHYGWNGNDRWHYAWLKDGNQVQHVCYEANHPRDVRHYSMAGTNYLTMRINKHPGQATAARIKDARDYGNISYASCVMGYIDQHGNESKVGVRGTSDGNMLYLADSGLKDEEPPPDEVDGG